MVQLGTIRSGLVPLVGGSCATRIFDSSSTYGGVANSENTAKVMKMDADSGNRTHDMRLETSGDNHFTISAKQSVGVRPLLRRFGSRISD